MAEALWKLELFSQGGLVYLIGILAVEGRQSCQHLVKESPKTVKIRCKRVSFFKDDFRRHILWAATKRISLIFCLLPHRLRQPKVCYFDMPMDVQQDILRLDVPIKHSMRVNVLQPKQDLNRIESRLLLFHSPKLLDQTEELASGAELSDEHDVIACLKCELEINHKRMPSYSLHHFQFVE